MTATHEEHSNVKPSSENDLFRNEVQKKVEEEGKCLISEGVVAFTFGVDSDSELKERLNSICEGCDLSWEREPNHIIKFT